MIPENRVSSKPVPSSFLNSLYLGAPLKGVEWGGKALNDASEGINAKPWTIEYVEPTGDVVVYANGVPKTTLFNRPDVTEVSLAFDRNMQPVVAFVQAGQAKLYFYDSLLPGFKFWETELGAAKNPRVTHDDKRDTQSGISDVIVAYVRDGFLRYRQQRDRYGVEITPAVGRGGAPLAMRRLLRVGMNVGARLQFAYEGVGQPASPFLADVVNDLLVRSGVKLAAVDAADLYTDLVEGFKVATEGGADSMIQTLQAAYFFDPSESDKKLRMVSRGGGASMDISADALVGRDDGPLTIDRVQEAELLRKVNVTMLDSSIDYTTNKQTAERRSNKIGAKAESSIEIPITASPDFQATVAMRRLNIAWGEMQTYEFELPMGYSALVPTDVVVLTDKAGRRHRMRLMEIQEDGGVLICKASQDAPWVYDAQAVGVQAPQPTPTTPGLVGDTTVVVLDIPVLRDQDDELGYYVGAVGTGRGWYGAEVQMSTDGGVNVGQSLQITIPSVIGSTLTALAQEVSSEYLSAQTLIVQVPEPLESIDREALLRYGNRAAVQRADGSWEVLQFQLVEQVSDDTFKLSGLVRGRYATGSLAAPVGARFVMIDDSLTFVQVQQWMTGTTISYRGVSYGQDSDEADWEAFAVDEPVSQQEWPVHYVRALRDGSNKVTVTWIGRGRLGVEIAPRNSKYFAGYRVSYSDGFTADTTESTHTRAATPAGVTVTVTALNTITGPGPASEAITA